MMPVDDSTKRHREADESGKGNASSRAPSSSREPPPRPALDLEGNRLYASAKKRLASPSNPPADSQSRASSRPPAPIEPITVTAGQIALQEAPWDARTLRSALMATPPEPPPAQDLPAVSPPAPPRPSDLLPSRRRDGEAPPPPPPPAGSQGLSAAQQRIVSAWVADHRSDISHLGDITNDGFNAMHLAVEDLRLGTADGPTVISILRACDVHCLSEFTTGGRPVGVAPIHMLCSGRDHEQERVDILREMIRLSASPSLKNKSNGATPLHRAAGSGSKALVQALLDAGAHVNSLNNVGASPYDAAEKSSGEVFSFCTANWFGPTSHPPG